MLPGEDGNILIRFVMEIAVGEKHTARHVRVVSGLADGPSKESAAYYVTQAVGIFGAYIGVALEFESGAKGIAGVEAKQSADDFGLPSGEGHSEVAADKGKAYYSLVGTRIWN